MERSRSPRTPQTSRRRTRHPGGDGVGAVDARVRGVRTRNRRRRRRRVSTVRLRSRPKRRVRGARRYVWRGLVLGLVDAPGRTPSPRASTARSSRSSSSGTSPGDAAWSRARRLREARGEANVGQANVGRAEPSDDDANRRRVDGRRRACRSPRARRMCRRRGRSPRGGDGGAPRAGGGRETKRAVRVAGCAPRVDENGVPIVKSLEVVGFEPARRTTRL